MKYMISIMAFVCSSLGAAHAQSQNFTIKGTISGSAPAYIYFKTYGEDRVQDSVKVLNGKFNYSGRINAAAQYFVSSKNKVTQLEDPDATDLYLEPGTMTLQLTSGNFKAAKLLGSQMQTEKDQLELEKKPIMDKFQPYLDQYNTANKALINAKKANKPEAEQEALLTKANEIKEKFGPFLHQMATIDQRFLDSHPDSYLTAKILSSKVSSMKADEAHTRFKSLTPRVQQSVWGLEVQKRIDWMLSGSPGSRAKAFATEDINGIPLKLSDYYGQYVLLDFWASWCVPCRKGNPNLLKLYAQYKDKGLEIIGVASDDQTQKAWKDAVQKDGIGIWRHVLRGYKKTENGYDQTNDISNSYGISSLPTKILIDPKGVIVGRYGDGGENDSALDKKLEEIFKKDI